MQAYVPSEIANRPELAFAPINLEAVREKGKDLAVSQLKLGRYPARLFLRGSLTTDGINHLESEWGDNYSFGFQFDEAEDATALANLQENLVSFLAETQHDAEYEIKPILKDEVLYLKCKTDSKQSKFVFTSNFKLHPKKPNTDVVRFMPIECQVDVGAWINIKNDTAGLYFTLKDVTFRRPDADTQDVDDAAFSGELPPMVPLKRSASIKENPRTPKKANLMRPAGNRRD